MQEIYDTGLVKKNEIGLYEVVDSPEEQQKLQEKRSKRKHRDNIDPLRYDDPEVELDLEEGLE